MLYQGYRGLVPAVWMHVGWAQIQSEWDPVPTGPGPEVSATNIGRFTGHSVASKEHVPNTTNNDNSMNQKNTKNDNNMCPSASLSPQVSLPKRSTVIWRPGGLEAWPRWFSSCWSTGALGRSTRPGPRALEDASRLSSGDVRLAKTEKAAYFDFCGTPFGYAPKRTQDMPQEGCLYVGWHTFL